MWQIWFVKYRESNYGVRVGIIFTDFNILTLEGLEHASELVTLDVSSNSISDLSYILGLTKLTNINISNNASISTFPIFTNKDFISVLDISDTGINSFKESRREILWGGAKYSTGHPW